MIEKKTKKPAAKKKSKKKTNLWGKVPDDKLKYTDSQKTIQEKLSKPEGEEDNIIAAHIKAVEKHPFAKGMRVEKIAFAIFLALPEAIRGDQRQFSKDWGISEPCLSAWKFHDDIQKLRMKIMKSVLMEKTPKVLENLFHAASERNAFGSVNTAAVKLWLQFTEEWEEASKLHVDASGGFTVNFGAGKSQFIQPKEEEEEEKE